MTAGNAMIRFYAELNDLLPSTQRQRDVPYRIGDTSSVKDAIESLGVPHTVVDMILANGTSVDLGYRLVDGDRISVYPVFERLDITDLTRVRSEPLRQVRFVAGAHLGTLVRRLRLLGLDARYDIGWSNDVLADISASERRILLTRDRELLERPTVTHGLFVSHDDPDEQAVDVVRRLHLSAMLRPFTRCTVCNGLLDDVDKDAVADRLQPRTRAHFEVFKRCRGCDRVYWEGPHHDRLEEFVERVHAQTSGEQSAQS